MDIPITEQQYYEYMTGPDSIQEFFPELDEEQREFIMTGITGYEWDKAFPKDPLDQTK